MTKEDLISLLVEDTLNEYQHMLFYLNSACHIKGFAREEIGEFLANEARDEMNHVEEFTKLLIEIGGSNVVKSALMQINTKIDFLDDLEDPKRILKYVLSMEEKVVERYTQRMEDAMSVGGVDGRFVEIFLEDQILDSKKTAAHVRMLLGD